MNEVKIRFFEMCLCISRCVKFGSMYVTLNTRIRNNNSSQHFNIIEVRMDLQFKVLPILTP